jgi:hypothetical protein
LEKWVVEGIGFFGIGLVFVASVIPRRRDLHVLRFLAQVFLLAYGFLTGTFAVIVGNFIGMGIDGVMIYVSVKKELDKDG